MRCNGIRVTKHTTKGLLDRREEEAIRRQSVSIGDKKSRRVNENANGIEEDLCTKEDNTRQKCVHEEKSRGGRLLKSA
jgi:hypothetical protein